MKKWNKNKKQFPKDKNPFSLSLINMLVKLILIIIKNQKSVGLIGRVGVDVASWSVSHFYLPTSSVFLLVVLDDNQQNEKDEGQDYDDNDNHYSDQHLINDFSTFANVKFSIVTSESFGIRPRTLLVFVIIEAVNGDLFVMIQPPLIEIVFDVSMLQVRTVVHAQVAHFVAYRIFFLVAGEFVINSKRLIGSFRTNTGDGG